MDEGKNFTRNIYQHKAKMSEHAQIFRRMCEDLTNNPESAFDSLVNILRTQGIELTGSGVKVLEVGSGNAKFLDFAKKHGVNITGVDINPRGATNESQAVARIEQLPFRNDSFDVVLSTGVFDEFIYDQYALLMVQEIRNVLKPGGVYVATEAENLPTMPGLNLVNRSLGVFKKAE